MTVLETHKICSLLSALNKQKGVLKTDRWRRGPSLAHTQAI